LKENIDSLNFTLDQADVDEISKIDEGHRICDGYPWLLENSIFA
jgi:diketogulonate reductase-like aldo/keto reductase